MNSINPVYHHSDRMLLMELEWIQSAKENPKDFGPLYKKYYEQIFRYIEQRMDDHEQAIDVTSQVFVKAIKNLYRYEYKGVPFGSWLYRIAKSELNQAFRDRKKKKAIPLEKAHLSSFMEVFKDEEKIIRKRKLERALMELKPRDLNILKMRYYEGMSYREIAEQLNITENNAKVKSFRAVERLKAVFFKL